MSEKPTPPVQVVRDDEEDHDLLTYGEAGARLYEAVLEQQGLVARLEAESSPELDKARSRLAALQAAAERNSRQPINDENFERFFGYPGTSRRNT